MATVYQCDRCGNIENIFNIVSVNAASSYFNNRKIDLCPNCYKLLFNFEKSEAKKANDN